MLGNLLGTHKEIAYVGEFFGFYFSTAIARRFLQRIPSTVKDRYLRELEDHADSLARSIQKDDGCRYFCDSTPWNALIAPELAKKYTNAWFVVAVRHYVGVIQSLERSHRNGYRMTENTNTARARLWAECYQGLIRVPDDRTILLDYDKLCVEPAATIGALLQRLSADLGLDVEGFDLRSLTMSHATGAADARGTVVYRDASGNLAFKQKNNYDSSTLPVGEREPISRVIMATVDGLKKKFPSLELPVPK